MLYENLLEAILRSLRKNAGYAALIIGFFIVLSLILNAFFPVIYEAETVIRVLSSVATGTDTNYAPLMQAYFAENSSLEELAILSGVSKKDTKRHNFIAFSDIGNGFVSLKVRHTKPEFLPKLSNSVSEMLVENFFEYCSEVEKLELSSNKSRLAHIENSLMQAQSELKKLESDNSSNNGIEKAINKEISSLNDKIYIAQKRIQTMPQDVTHYVEEYNANYQGISTRLKEEKDNLAQLLLRYREKHPKVVELNDKIETLNKELASAVRKVKKTKSNPEYSKLKTTIDSDINKLAALKKELLNLKTTDVSQESSLTLNNLKLRVATLEEMHKQTLLKIENSEFAHNNSTGDLRVLNKDSQTARNLGLSSMQRDTLVMLSGLLAAIFFLYTPAPVRAELVGINAEMLAEVMEKANCLRLTAEPTVSALLEAPSLSMDPLALPPPLADEQEHTLIYDERLIALNCPDSPALLPFKNLVSNLLVSIAESESRIVLIGSARSGKGRTTLLANTAILMAQAGYSVLMVDADYRNPTLHKIFDLESTRGLSDGIGGDRSPSLLQQTYVNNLLLMSTGMVLTNPANAFASQAMIELLSDLRRRVELILIDTPALLEYPETSVLAGQTGAMVFLNPDKELNEDIKASRALLKSVRAKIFGYVTI